MKIKVNTPIKYKGVRHEIGDIVEVYKKDEKELSKYGTVVKETVSKKSKSETK